MKRKCCQCGKEKPVSQFYRRLDGYQSRCKVCDNGNRVTRMQVTTYATNAGIKIGDGGATHEEIAAVLGVTRARVQQIEAGALRKLRALAEKRGVRA